MLVGTETADDAGVYRLRPDLAIVNTVDFFTPIVDDPYLFGQISATNSLSDVYAMGGEPKTCMNIVCFPKGKMDISILGDILRGGADKVKETGAVIIGGHSIIDDAIKYGMSVTGVVHPDKIFRNVGVQEGDVLILTKALGTGIITTALKRGKASEESVKEAVTSMTTLNAAASFVARKHQVHAISDVTGFGVLGHAQEMASGSGVTLVLESAKLPLLKGASIVGVFWGEFVNRELPNFIKDLTEMFGLIAQGKLRPHVSARYPLAEGAQALNDLMNRKATGKVVITSGAPAMRVN